MGKNREPGIPWLQPGEPFPPVSQALDDTSEAPGLLAAGGALDSASLRAAYSQGIFPWFSDGQPVLWWSPDPRMVLQVADFRLHRSMRKTLRRFIDSDGCEVRFDSAFAQVIGQCAASPRGNSSGTWIVPAMQQAYLRLHLQGHAHSVETWIDGVLVGGLYCVAIGRAVYGESMFSQRSDASKIALAALVAFCHANGIASLDCQQNTRHLASMGAAEIPRSRFVAHCAQAARLPAPQWKFKPLYWMRILPERQAQP